MVKKAKLIRVILSLVAIFIAFANVAHARKSPTIFDTTTGKIISVRDDAYIYTFAADGNHWTFATEIKGHAGFNAITYGRNTYVAVADDSTIWYLSNDDSAGKWKEASLSGEANFQAVEFGNGMFVAVADEGTIWYSTDGRTWNESKSADLSKYSPDFHDVIYANGVFVAVGGVQYNGDSLIFCSSDGMSWHVTFIGDGRSDHGNNLTAIAYGKNTFVAVGGLGDTYISKNNGQTWENVSSTWEVDFTAVTFNKDLFVAVGDNATIQFSKDGTNWKTANIDASSIKFWDVTYGNGVFVAVGDLRWNTTSSPIWYSKDGINWVQADGIKYDYGYAAKPYFEAVYFDGANFVATARTSSTSLPEYYSRDGITWQTNQGGVHTR